VGAVACACALACAVVPVVIHDVVGKR
jgi:hypothetical protein